MKVQVAVINAFVDQSSNLKNGGNPAGVVLGADSLTKEQKLAIAQQVGYSETAFVSDSLTADFKLEFFTPQRQIAHCGHATIATFSYLSQQGLVKHANTSKETVDGNRKVFLEGQMAYMEQLAPSYLDVQHEKTKIATALGIPQEAIVAEPMVVNTGNAFLVVGVKDIDQLEAIIPDQSIIEALSETYDLIGFYVFTRESNQEGRSASTRMFAPRYGIAEESATGMAAGPLACYLYDQLGIKQDRFLIEQGYSMQPQSPSCIEVSLSLKAGAIQSLMAGGIGVASEVLEVDV